jgi:hypothetical protein
MSTIRETLAAIEARHLAVARRAALRKNPRTIPGAPAWVMRAQAKMLPNVDNTGSIHTQAQEDAS